MNDGSFLEKWASDGIGIVLAIISGVMWAVRKLVCMDQRLSTVEISIIRTEQEREKAKQKIEELVVDVAEIKADVRNGAENTARILDILERK